jgi:hypothetical protein
MNKTLLILIFCLSIYTVQAQIQDDDIYEHIASTIQNANSTLIDCDPYGFALSVKVSFGGSKLYPPDKTKITDIVNRLVLRNQRFARFNLEKDVKIAPSKDILYMTVGAAPDMVPEIGYDVTSYNKSVKVSTNGITEIAIVHVSATYIVSKPNDGAVLGQLKYSDGGYKSWSTVVFPTLPAEQKAHVNYRRLGPGDSNANTGDDKKEDWHRLGNISESDFQIQERTPGHYFPSVKFRNCVIRYEDPDKDQDKEVIVKAEGRVDWQMKASASASRETGKDIETNFSLHNIVKGHILDENNQPVRDKKQRTVRLESKGWWFADRTPQTSYFEVITFDDVFEFDEIPSGVYYLYLKGQPKQIVVEVCNCDGPDRTYYQNIGGKGEYFITMETTYTRTDDLEALSYGEFGSSGTGQVSEVAKTKTVWQISDIEIQGNNGESSFLKGVYDYPLESHNTTKVNYQVPELSLEKDKWDNITDSWTSNQVPQKSIPYIHEINQDENTNRGFRLTDMFEIIPMFDDDTPQKEIDLSGIQDEGMKNLLKSGMELAKAAKPLTEMVNDMEDGKYIVKQKAKAFSLSQLVAVAKGGTMSLTDKTVQRVEKQADNFLSMDKQTADGMKKLGRTGNVDFAQMSKAQGGLSNYVMTNNYNRPTTTTITRTITLRKATEAELKEANVKYAAEILEEATMGYPDGLIKSIRINY